MRTLLLLLWLIAYPSFAAAQIECGQDDYQKMKQDYQTEFQATRFEKAQAILLAAQNCKEADQKWIATELDLVIAGIAAQRDKAEKQKLTAYANDLVYKSQIALRDSDRTTAFRLAEFAHRYVDDDDLQVTRALFDALYYNDNPAHSPLLWASNYTSHLTWDAVRDYGFSADGKREGWGTTEPRQAGGKAALMFEGHSAAVTSVAFSPDGKRLATGSEDKTAIVWDLESIKAPFSLEGHSNVVTSIAFSPDGKRLATGSDDKTAKIWDLESGKAVLTLEEHLSSVLSVAFSPDGKRLATASGDETAKIWDLETGKAVLTLEGGSTVLSVAFSPDGKRLAMGVMSMYDQSDKIWDSESGETVLTLYGSSNTRSVAFSPDGKRLATAGGLWDPTARIWDLETGKSVLTLEGHSDGVISVAFSPDGKRLATGSVDGTAKIWDLESNKAFLTLVVCSSFVNGVAFSPDGKRLATGGGKWINRVKIAKIWEITPQGILAAVGQEERFAGLYLPQLLAYNLEDLLDLRPENESILLQTADAFQISIFADLYMEAKTNPKKADYERALRLYQACLDRHRYEPVKAKVLLHEIDYYPDPVMDSGDYYEARVAYLKEILRKWEE